MGIDNLYQVTTEPSDVIASQDSAAGASVTATTTTPAAGYYWLIHGWEISATAAPAAPVQATLARPTMTVPNTHIQVPASAFAVMGREFRRGLRGAPGQAVSLTVPGLGGSTVCTVTLYGTLVQVV